MGKVEDLIKQGKNFFDDGKMKNAVKIYQQAIKIDPENAKAWFSLSLVFDNLNKYHEALHAIEQALEYDTKDGLAWYNKGVYLERLGRFNKALEAAEQAVKLNPEYAAAWRNKGYYLRSLERYLEAFQAYEHSLKIEPNHEYALINKKELEILANDDVNLERMKKFEKILQKTTAIRLSLLAKMLTMEEEVLLDWLFELPDKYGIVLTGEMVQFDYAVIQTNFLTEHHKIRSISTGFGKYENKTYHLTLDKELMDILGWREGDDVLETLTDREDGIIMKKINNSYYS